MADELKKIGNKIVLEGEKEYSAALKEAQRNLKVLRSELKAETAELGKNATEQQKNETRTKNLQKQIKEQEKVVRTYEKALKEIRERYGDNEEAIAKWEIKLNDARTALANMQNSLNQTGKAMQNVGSSAEMGVVAANSFAESLGRVAQVGSSISDSIENAFKGITERIADTIAQVWESIVDLAARSNNLVDLAGFWNTDVTTIQKYKGAVAEASGSLEDLNSIVTRINAGDAKKIAELTGVSNVNYKDQWQYAMAVMDAMSQMSKERRNEVGFEIFGGRQATKAFDLLNDWSTVLANLDKYDVSKGGYGLTEEQLQNMSDLYDKVNGLKASWQALKDMAMVRLFGDVAVRVSGNLQSIIDAFKEYFQADTQKGRQEALDKIKENVTAIFTNIAEAIRAGIQALADLAKELQESDDPATKTVGGILQRIVDVLNLLAGLDFETIRAGFDAIIGVWAAGKIGTALGYLGSFAGHIETIWRMITGNKTPTTPGLPTVAPDARSNPTTRVGDRTTGTGTVTLPSAGEIALDASGAGAGVVFSEVFGQGLDNLIGEYDFKQAVDKMLESHQINMDDPAIRSKVEELLLGMDVFKVGTMNDGSNFDYNALDLALADIAANGGASATANHSYYGKPKTAEDIWTDVQQIANQFVEHWTKTIPNAWNEVLTSETLQNALQKSLAPKASETGIALGDESWADLVTSAQEVIQHITQVQEEAVQRMEEAGEDFANPTDLLPADEGNFFTYLRDFMQKNNAQDDTSGLKSIPGQMKAAVKEGVENIRVTLDGERVGRLVAPYVSQQIARDAYV